MKILQWRVRWVSCRQLLFTVLIMAGMCAVLLQMNSLYMNSIYVDPEFLQSPMTPTVAPLTVHDSKLVELAKEYSHLKPDPSRSISYKGLSYIDVVAKLAGGDKLIILSLVDGGFLQMALNFYISCIEGFAIRNYLFLATDQASCDRLLAVGIHCFVYREDVSANEASEFGQPDFLRKMNIRTDMILEALQHGFQVLHSDVDIVCQKHPVEYLDCPGCDVATLWDSSGHNAGFVFTKPTRRGIEMYDRMREMVLHNTTLADQIQMNDVLKAMRAEYDDFTFRDLGAGFQCGLDYYETPGRFFAPHAAPCPECVLVHNNWIVSMEAKVYRAKEMHHWLYDGDQYYTSTSRKYLAFDNPLIGRYLTEIELNALASALAFGQILNRTVILPKFHCATRPCPLNSLINIKLFDKQFGILYREHTFLSHPLVPESVRASVHGPVVLKTKYLVDHAGLNLGLVPRTEEVTSRDLDLGMTDAEVWDHFGHVQDSVLRFFSMYDAFKGFEDPAKNETFKKKIASGIVRDAYKNTLGK